MAWPLYGILYDTLKTKGSQASFSGKGTYEKVARLSEEQSDREDLFHAITLGLVYPALDG